MSEEPPPSYETVAGSAVKHAEIIEVQAYAVSNQPVQVQSHSQVVPVTRPYYENLENGHQHAQLESDSGYDLPGGPRGSWKDGLCDYFNAIPNCCMVLFCIWQPVAFEFERVSVRNSYIWMAPLLLILWFAATFLSNQEFMPESISGILEIFWWVVLTTLINSIRANVRQKYNIPSGCCGSCEDCCCSFWCTACVACQIWRHITGNNPRAKGCTFSSDPEKGCC
jgi:Cys-rich protein (TIGR01571 family)